MLKKAGLVLGVLVILALAACGGPSTATFEISNHGKGDVTLKSVTIGGQVVLEEELVLKPSPAEGASFNTRFERAEKVIAVLVIHDSMLGGTVTYETELEMPKKKTYSFKLLYSMGHIVTVTTEE